MKKIKLTQDRIALVDDEDFDLDLRRSTAYSELKSLISSLLAEQKKELVEEIRKWTKGKDVTKDKLRQYLNLLKG